MGFYHSKRKVTKALSNPLLRSSGEDRRVVCYKMFSSTLLLFIAYLTPLMALLPKYDNKKHFQTCESVTAGDGPPFVRLSFLLIW